MAFEENPLSLSIPDPAFQSWLREVREHLMDEADDGDGQERERGKKRGVGLLWRRGSGGGGGRRGSSSSRSVHSAEHSISSRSSMPPPVGATSAMTTRDGFSFGSLWSIVDDLTYQDLTRSPCSWTDEFLSDGTVPTGGGGETSTSTSSPSYSSYSWPIDWEEAKLRLQINLRKFMGNYLVITLLVLLSVLCRKPIALLGLGFLMWVWGSFHSYVLRQRLDPQKTLYKGLRGMLWILTWVVALYCKLNVALMMSGFISLLFVGAHGSFRKLSPSSKVGRRR
ncbi:hypothetical protein CBR_g39602 [Chara braunii]|uniref:PRA1 family protein n=1 Tax=Chara braunii TaxID=69332 RepID=A0A388K1A3_CHABU|nr:hypothetical protein CBR_g39602 [Chara braunii]|eukprot:GBG63818.1 hypothetical protein CBR_g39602 [Chara braunii]